MALSKQKQTKNLFAGLQQVRICIWYCLILVAWMHPVWAESSIMPRSSAGPAGPFPVSLCLNTCAQLGIHSDKSGEATARLLESVCGRMAVHPAWQGCLSPAIFSSMDTVSGMQVP